MAVASFQPAAVVYREEQNFDWRVYLLLAFVEMLSCAGLIAAERQGHDLAARSYLSLLVLSAFVMVGVVMPGLLAVGFLRMTTEVTPGDLRVWFGWVPTYRRFVPIDSVRRLEVVNFRPLLDHGGWGVRAGRDGERVLSARGSRGVRVELTDGTILLVGSQRPEELATAIEGALRPG